MTRLQLHGAIIPSGRRPLPPRVYPLASATIEMSTTDMLQQARELAWYHTIELPGYTTPGWFDLRPYVDRYGLPARLDGLRALDIGTWDGFWAFELERRGAEVVAIDVEDEREYDWPPRRRPDASRVTDRGQAFRVARELLSSKVQRVGCNVYDATPERLGMFDLVFCGSVLTHVRDQLLALERMASVCRGRLIIAEEYERLLSLLPVPVSRYRADREKAVVFWVPNVRAWKRMLWTAGFDAVADHARFKLRVGSDFAVPHVVLHASRASGSTALSEAAR
jgi:tRNA (mo5U34)-methyltransferase